MNKEQARELLELWITQDAAKGEYKLPSDDEQVQIPWHHEDGIGVKLVTFKELLKIAYDLC